MEGSKDTRDQTAFGWTLTAEQQSFRDEVRRWLATELTAPYLDGLAHRSATEFFGIEPRFSRALGDAGYLGVTTDPRYGGQGRSHVEQAMLQSELAAHRAPILGHFVAEREVLPALLHFGSEQQRERFVPELLRGRMLCAQLFTEPQTGSDLAAVATTARPSGSGFVLSGVKWLNSVAHVASHLWIIARTGSEPRHRGLSMFLVAADAPGVRIEPLVEMTGVHRLNQIVLDEVEIAADALVGPLNGGWSVAMDAVTRERSGSTRTSMLGRTLAELAAHRAPGSDRPLIEDPSAELELAALSVRVDACDALWQRYSWQTDHGLANPDLAGATLKVYGDAVEQDLGDLGTRLLARDGVRDIDEDAPLGGRLARLHLAGPGLSLGGGVAEVLKSMIATRGLGLPRDPWRPA